MQSCPKCGKPLRYIPASGPITSESGESGVYTVEADPVTLISERGRIITGYRIHKCGGISNGDKDGKEKAGDG
jgi:hypothetical protein